MTDTVFVLEQTGLFRVLAAVLFVVGVGFLSWLGIRNTSARIKKLFLLSLRVTSLLFMGLLLLGPSLQNRVLTQLKSRLAILVDESQSMSVGNQKLSRAERVARFFQQQRADLDRLRSKFQLETYAFAEQLRAVQAEQLGKTAAGRRTDIAEAVVGLVGTGKDQDHGIAGVILVSDGADTESLKAWEDQQAIPVLLRDALRSLGAPINTLLVKDQRDFIDLAVTHVAYQEFGFIRNAVELQATISSRGFENSLEVPVSLEQGGRTLASKTVRLPSNGIHEVKLRFVPDTVGKFAYRVRIPVLEGEVVTDNNSRDFISSVIRDKTRILQVVGRPSWDQRFLRDVLRRNPNIDLVSFYILRNMSDEPGVSEQELSLIPFPVAKLFNSELATFDVVIFQNFDHGPYNAGSYLEQLADYVRRGGAFCMLGGDLSFGAGGYAATPVAEILPVRLQAANDWRVGEYQPAPVAGWLDHPVMDVGKPGVWERLPSLGSFHLVQSVFPDAQVLLEHPFARAGNQPVPILALREVERGRSAALLTDGSWRWAFRQPVEAAVPQFYSRFWNNLLRWLVRDPAFSPIILRSHKSHYVEGEPLNFELRAHGFGLGALGEKTAARLVVRDADSGNIMQSKLLMLDARHTNQIELPTPGTGAFVAGLEFPDRPSMEKVQELFFVEDESVELKQPSPRPLVLKEIAEFTGGEYRQLGEGSLDELAFRTVQRYRVESSTTRPLLERVWVLAILFGLLGLEWWLRRSWGYA